MKTIGIYAGTFDPLTNGHIDIIKRSFKFCDQLIIGIGDNANKQPMFSPMERTRMMLVLNDILDEQQSLKWKARAFQGLLVDFAKEEKATILIRGIRSVSDFEYEINLSNVNKVLAPEIETVFLPTSPELAVVSSSMIKEVAKHGGDISKFVPQNIAKDVVSKFGFEKTGYKKHSDGEFSVGETKQITVKSVLFPEFECNWCGEGIGDGSVKHMCNKTPRIKRPVINEAARQHDLTNKIISFYNRRDGATGPDAFKVFMKLVLDQIPEEESTLNSLVLKFSGHPSSASDCKAAVLQLKAEGKISLDEKGMIRKI